MFEECLAAWGIDPQVIYTQWTWPKYRRMSAAMNRRKQDEMELQARMQAQLIAAMFGGK